MTKLADNAIILILSGFVGHFGTIIAGMILVRCLSRADYGSFLQVNLVATTITGFVLLGIPSTIFYFVPQLNKEQAKGFINQSLFILLCLGAIASALIYIFRTDIFGLINNLNLADYSFLVGLILIGRLLTEAAGPIFITTGRAIFVGYVNVGQIIVIITTYFVLWKLGFGLGAILTTLAACLLMQFLFTVIYVSKFPGVAYHLSSPVSLRNRFKYSMPLGLSRIANMFGRSMDQFIIAGVYSPTDYAIYGRGAMALPIIPAITQSISNVLLPKFVSLRKEGRHEDIIAIWHKSLRKVIIVSTAVFIFFFFFAKEFIVVFFTDKYLASAAIFQIYLLASIIEVLKFGIIHQAFGRTKIILYIQLSVMGMNVVLNLLCYKLFGFLGPAIGTLATRYFFHIINLSIIKEYFKVSLREIYPWGYHFKMLAIGFGGIIPALSIKSFELSNLSTLILGSAIYAPIYLGLLFVLHILDEDDKNLIMSWINLRSLKEKLVP